MYTLHKKVRMKQVKKSKMVCTATILGFEMFKHVVVDVVHGYK